MLPGLAHAKRAGSGVAFMAESYASGRARPLLCHRLDMFRTIRPFVPSHIVPAAVIRFPLTYAYMQEFSQTEADRSQILTPVEKAALRACKDTMTKPNIRVLLFEIFTCDRMQGHRQAFLTALRTCSTESGLLLVLDDTTMSIRGGRLFSFLNYGNRVIPDLVVLGKAWQAATLLALRVLGPQSLLKGCVEIGECLLAHLGPCVTRIEKEKEKEVVVYGVGAIWVTNLIFKGRVSPK